MQEVMMMIALLWSSPVAFDETLASPKKPAQPVATKPVARKPDTRHVTAKPVAATAPKPVAIVAARPAANTVARAQVGTVTRPQAALAKAAAPAATKPVARRHAILFFTAGWCPACLRMKSETLPYLSLPGYELRIIDFDQNPGLGQSYGISSLPGYVVLDGMGRAYRQGVGFRDVQQFVNFLNGR